MPSIAFLADLMVISNTGSINGKPITEIKMLLFPELDAMADTMVKIVDNPIVNKTETPRY